MRPTQKHMETERYRYELPAERIAQYPLEQRDESKLLVYRNGQIHDRLFKDLPDEIPADSVLVRNNTRVIQARLEFTKDTGACIEVFCLEPANPPDYERNLSQTGSADWFCLIGNAKKWKSGVLQGKLETPAGLVTISAKRLGQQDQKELVRFTWTPARLTLSQILDYFGQTPIPPYLQRPSEDADKVRYQTIYARFDGSVAAPTAGLHMTRQVEEQLADKSIFTAELILHVGAGTFTPVKSGNVLDHQMHTEYLEITRSQIHHILNNDQNGITALGTTTLRTLESLYWLGWLLKNKQVTITDTLHIDQWLPYEADSELSRRQALLEILVHMNQETVEVIRMTTALIIIPGYTIRMADRLITNFHQPGSTLLMLVAACAGDDWQHIYQHALEKEYRFLSYGDSSLLHLSGPTQ